MTIEACACGVVHLHFGPTSLRLTVPAVHELSRALQQACVGIEVDARALGPGGLRIGGVRGLA